MWNIRRTFGWYVGEPSETSADWLHVKETAGFVLAEVLFEVQKMDVSELDKWQAEWVGLVGEDPRSSLVRALGVLLELTV